MTLARYALVSLAWFVFLAAPVQASATRIAFVGDSMADGIWGAFFRLAGRQGCEADQIAFIRDARNGTGLARTDNFNWFDEIDRLIAAHNPNLIVASFGLNDQQAVITPAKAKFTFGSDRWFGAYKDQVTAFLTHATAGGTRVLIVGLPTLRNAKANDHAQRLNAIYAEAAAGNPNRAVTYVEPWKPEGSDGAFASYGQSLGGATVQLRAPDGVHFTPAGYDVVAAYLKAPLSNALTDQRAPFSLQCFGL